MSVEERQKPKEGSLPNGTLVGRYRIIAHIADGGMASVYLADLAGPGAFSKRVALKVIHRHLMSESSFITMFMDEARIAARLHHPSIVQTYDLIETGEHLAIAMEYAPGVSLSALRSQGALQFDAPPELVGLIGAEIASALGHAHELTDEEGEPLGVVHRDVSPRNIHVGFDGRIRLVDFGIARARDRLGQTATGTLMGTFAYMAPEQSQGQADSRSDLWSLGVILWELLARRRLFRGKTEADTMHSVLFLDIPPLHTVRSDVPPVLEVAVHRALQRDPNDRWARAHDLEEALRAALPRKVEALKAPLLEALEPHRMLHRSTMRKLLGDTSRFSTPVPYETAGAVPAVEGERPSEDVPPTAVVAVSSTRKRRRWRRLAVGIVLGSVLVAGGAAAWLAGDRKDGEAPPDRTAQPGGAEGTASKAPVAQPEPPPPVARTPAPIVSLDVRSDTPGARVLLDGEPLGNVPVHTTVERDEELHVVRVEAPGFVPEERTVPLASPVEIAVELEREDRPRASGRRREGRKGGPGLIFDEGQLY